MLLLKIKGVQGFFYRKCGQRYICNN